MPLLILAIFMLGWSGLANSQWDGPPAKVIPAYNSTYIQACGACHFPYPPGLLPARSWEALIAGLEEHFGENAELSSGEVGVIRDYLLTNAADRSENEFSKSILKSIHFSQITLRITNIPLIKNRHSEVIAVLGDEQQFSECIACHPDASNGDFSEKDAQIPGMGQWEGWDLK